MTTTTHRTTLTTAGLPAGAMFWCGRKEQGLVRFAEVRQPSSIEGLDATSIKRHQAYLNPPEASSI